MSVEMESKGTKALDGHSPTSKSEGPAPVIPSFEMPESSLDARYDMGLNEKLEYSKNLTPVNQSKKELYIKLDEILITSLHESFEVHPGSSVDRVEMVEFLSSVVRRNIPVCPDLEKIMCLRDTVLTARVKRAFPEVEYKRKQIRQDHFRKAWLYVNIRRKLHVQKNQDESKNIPTEEDLKTAHSSGTKASVLTSGTWTPEVSLRSTNEGTGKKRQTPLNTPSSQSPPILSRKSVDDLKTSHKSNHSKQKTDSISNSRSLSSLACGPVSMVTGYNPRERSAVVLDNYTIAKWVKSNYLEDNTSYVPVQDVVKAFKTSYGIDITYKECHQMIYSAFTSPRQRTCPLKTVRVSSMGAQYVYRGIAPARPTDRNEDLDEDACMGDSSPDMLQHGDSIQEEKEEVWRKLVEELKQERDQSMIDRNQALSALMDLEKDHAHALAVIDHLRKDLDVPRVAERNPTVTNNLDHSGTRIEETRLSPSNFERFSESSASKAESNMLSALAPTCEKCCSGKQAYEHLKEERDQIWRDILQQTSTEKEEAMKRLEVVKSERDAYLERLHGFEKENQALRDSVAVPPTKVSSMRTAIKIETRAQALRSSIIKSADSTSTKNGRDSLNSALLHLKSKRKQSTPTKFNKVSRLSNSENENQLEILAPTLVDSGLSSPGHVFAGFQRFRGPQDPSDRMTSHCANGTERDVDFSPESVSDPNEMLLYFEGSDMVAFKPHPMED